MCSYREVIPPMDQTCGNCRFWDMSNLVEVPMYKNEEILATLAPCKRFISDEYWEHLSGWRPDRMFTDQDRSCPDWCWMPSREYLEVNPQCRIALAEACREEEAA